MSGLRVHLLGRLQIETDNGVVEGLDARKVQELLVYLLLHRNRQHSREAIADLLWGDSKAAQPKKSLRQALWQMQSALAATGTKQCLLITEAEWIGINPDMDFWLDIEQFEVNAASLGNSCEKLLDPAKLQKAEAALQIYQGDLLEGWYNDWCLFERERLQDLYLTILSRLIEDAELRAEYQKGIAYGEKILRYDSAHERTHQRLMRLRYRIGDRTAALRQFERCTLALQRELDVKPSQETLDLCMWIKSEGSRDPKSANPLLVARPDLWTLFETLHQVHRMMNELQSQMQHYLANEITASIPHQIPSYYYGEPDV